MSTHCTITAKLSTGEYITLYCHYDGYPSHVGAILQDHYTNQAKIDQLMLLGDLSVLAPSIECPPNHSFNTPVKGHTIAYHRDRGEPLQLERYSTYKLSLFYHGRQEYNYLWDNNEWCIC